MLENDLKYAASITSLKYNFNHQSQTKVPPHFFHGGRYLSVIHARLRNRCSNLNFDLYENHLTDIPNCSYCNRIEDAEHYLFTCIRFLDQRIILFRATRFCHPLNTKTLLYGRENLSHEENIQIVDAVHKFIKDTKRFTN